MTDIKERGDQMEEDCGVFGIYAQDEHINAAEAAYYGLFALQHRGQESAGIAVADGKGIKHYRNLGLVPEVFDEEILSGLKGKVSIGHVRYSTFGGKDVINAQPLVARCKIGMLAVAHNGNLVNADALRSQMEEDGAIFQTTVDTEVILSLIARESSKGLVEAIRSMMNVVRGSYALVLLAKDKLIGIRDPYGIRPLCLGRVGNSFVLASESCALNAVGAEFVRDVQPGEIVVIDEEGIHSTRVKTPMRSRLCLFEFVYFARPDSVIDGINVYQSRVEAGKRLAMDDDVEADMVIGVPDSALAAAIGYAQQSGIPYGDGLAKNRYVGRTFIQPEQGMRELGENILYKSNYAQKKLAGLKGVTMPYAGSHSFMEFVLNFDGTGKTVAEVNKALLSKHIFGGYDLSREMPQLGQSMLVCVTEKTALGDIDKLADALAEIL